VTRLREEIEREIRTRGPIPFSRYMELCLYHPELGYYSRNAEQFGKAGDFYTASDVDSIFGRLLARHFDEMWRVLGSPRRIEIVELGPGRGMFAQDVLNWSESKFPDFFHALSYMLVERSPALRERIKDTLARFLKSGRASLAEPYANTIDDCFRAAPWLSPPGGPLTNEGASASEVPAIVFANEFFDALPVEILSTKGSLRVDVQGNHLIESWTHQSSEELEFLNRYSVHPEPDERLEGALAAQQHMENMAACIKRGFLIAIDYGYTREEQLAGRHRGTLKAIRRHSMSGNSYEAPGEQDLTANVNFSALAAAAEKYGWCVQKLVTQSQFLMGIGEANQFADIFESCRLPQEHAKRALQLKHLATPAGLGESFHVLVASKGIEKEKTALLSGLSFGRQIARRTGNRR
jgi:SAM-dependent MidA family methyltransferase